MAECGERPYGRERISAIHFPVGPIAEEPHWKMDCMVGFPSLRWDAGKHHEKWVGL